MDWRHQTGVQKELDMKKKGRVSAASTNPYAWAGGHLDQQWHNEKSLAALPAGEGKYQVHVPVFESDVVKVDELCSVRHGKIMWNCNWEN